VAAADHAHHGEVRSLADLIDLVLPVTCVCCRRPGSVWCAQCRPPVEIVGTELASGLRVVSTAEYGGTMRKALLAFKERGNRALVLPLAARLAHAVDDGKKPGYADPAHRPVLVAVPSRRSAARERGGDHIARLVRQVVRAGEFEATQALVLTGRVHDSAGLTTAQRMTNLSGRMRAQPPVDGMRPALIVDDIVTTGATLIEANRALTAAGWTVLGAATIAATRRRWQPALSDARGAREGEPLTTIL
jgi:predicted amidophosphoribosyltransferase